MFFFIVGYSIIELVNIAYTSRYGLADPMDQPPAYRQIRMILKCSKYVLAFLAGVTHFSTSILIFLLFIIAPFIVERALFVYCRFRQKKVLIETYMSEPNDILKDFYMRLNESPLSNGRRYPMNKGDAQEQAARLIDIETKGNIF